MRDFGAAGDGAADDTEAVQSALDAAARAGGGTVVFPGGTYLVSGLRAAPGLTLEGRGATLKRARPDRGAMLAVFHQGPRDSAPLALRDLAFDGAAGPGARADGSSLSNRLVCPGTLLVEDSDLIVSPEAGPARYAAVDLWWSHEVCGGIQRDQTVTLRNVRLRADGPVPPGSKAYAILARGDAAANHNVLVVEGGHIAPELQAGLSMSRGGRWLLRGVAVDGPIDFTVARTSTPLAPVGGRLDATIER